MNQTHKKLLSNYCLPLLILLIGFVFFFTDSVEIVSDMGFYMNAGMNMIHGKGYTDMDGSIIIKRGPLFPLFISASYLLLGLSAWSAFWIVRIFAILNPLIVYLLGKRLYGKWIGFSAALLILSSYNLNYWSYRHLDAVWPFFVLLSILVVYTAMEKKNYGFFVLSGLLMAFAFYIKQAPILLLPLPFFLWALGSDFRNRNNFIGSFLYLIVFVALIFPWVAFVYSHTFNIKYSLLGGLGETAAMASVDPNFFVAAKKYFLGFFKYFFGGSNSLAANFMLNPLFVISWLFTFIRAIKKDKSSLVLAICLSLLSPFMAYSGIHNLRVGQLILFLLLCYLVTALFLFECANFTVKRFPGKFKNKASSYQYINFLLIGLLIVLQTLVSYKNDKSNLVFLKNSFLLKKAVGSDVDWQIEGIYGTEYRRQDSLDWILDQIPRGSKVICDWYWRGRSLYFYTQGRYPFYNMPIQKIYELTMKTPSFQTYEENFLRHSPNKNEKIIFLASWNDIMDQRNHFYYLSEPALLEEIEKNGIEYVIVSERRNFLSKYFDANPAFNKLSQFYEGRLKVYAVLNTEPLTDLKTCITRRTSQFLIDLKEKDRKRYLWFKEQLFQKKLGWGEDEMRMIEERNYSDDYEEVILYKIY